MTEGPDAPRPAEFVDPWVRVHPLLVAVLPPPQPPPLRWALALTLLAVTFVTTTTLGAVWVQNADPRVPSGLLNLALPSTFTAVWSDPAKLALGLAFALPALFILLCHEAGHFLACQRYRLPATLPYFLPAPVALGTLGAFIRIRAPIRRKQELFDVGVAGPIAGFVALLPFLVWGVAASEVVDLAGAAASDLFVPGHNLLFAGLIQLLHGSLGPDQVLVLHPFAHAAWFGLLATALNLLPFGQLDGGHVLYAVVGSRQRRLAIPLWLALTAAAWFWPGWLLWSALTLVLGLFHPAVVDEQVPLDPTRRALAGVALLIFVLSFLPVPITDRVLAP